MSANRPDTLNLPPLPAALQGAPEADVLSQAYMALHYNQLDRAAACFREVHQRDPNNDYVLLELIKVYFQMLEFDEGARLLGQLVARAGKNADVLIRAGEIYEDARHDQQAEHCFLQALRAAPRHPLVWFRLIHFYETKGMLPKAAAALAKAKEKNVRGPLLSLARAIIGRRTGDEAAAVAALEAALAKLPPQDPAVLRGRYHLAQAMGQSGQEAESIAQLQRAKRLQEQQPEVAANREVGNLVLQEIRLMAASMAAADLRGWPADVAAAPMRPLVFLIGYPRSGTTLLEQVIESHPRVHSLEETTAFDRAVRVACPEWIGAADPWGAIAGATAEQLARARQVYFQLAERLGAPADPDIVLVDKNPALIGRLFGLCRVFPEAKLLFMIRDPRDICLSAFQQHVGVAPFNVHWLRWDDTVRHCAAILQHWIQVRPLLPNPVIEVRYEDLVADLPATGRKVMDFLELDWRDEQQDFVSHARGKTVYSPSAYQVRQGLNQKARGKWRRFGMDYSAGGAEFSAVLAEYGYEAT